MIVVKVRCEKMFIHSCEILIVIYALTTGVFEAVQLFCIPDDDYVSMLYGMLGFAFGWIIFPICLIKHLNKADNNGGEL